LGFKYESLFIVLNLAKSRKIKKDTYLQVLSFFSFLNPLIPKENTQQYTIMEPLPFNTELVKQAGERCSVNITHNILR
jgi:hypothetical protein